jgi:alpha-1,2-mannosyltransferase
LNHPVARVAERLADRLRAFAQPWELGIFIWLPAIVFAYACWQVLQASTPLDDFGIFRSAAKDVLHGESPYVPADPRALAHFDKFVYPPSTALLFAPFTELPIRVGSVLMLVVGLGASLAALRLLDVRDWRCYGAAAMSAPVINSLALGAVTPFLLVGAAATWRYRDRPAVAGSVAALTAATKLFLWPLGLWLLVTRRLRAMVAFALVATVFVIGGWAVIGFAGFRSYPHLLHVLSQVEAGASYSLVAALGVDGTAATVLSIVLVGLVVLAVTLAARGRDGDRRSFAIAIVGTLVATPVVWLHYFALLLIPIALYRPRLSALWFAPVALWLTPASHANGSPWKIGIGLAVLALVVARTTAERSTRPLVWRPARIPLLRARNPQSVVGTE